LAQDGFFPGLESVTELQLSKGQLLLHGPSFGELQTSAEKLGLFSLPFQFLMLPFKLTS
jgi:hypothetical protein